MKYNFKSARARIDLLTNLYRIAKQQGNDLACWALAAQAEEIETEIAEAHEKAAARNSDHQKIFYIGIVAQSEGAVKV